VATTLELIAMLREVLDDEVHPYLWTNSYLVKALTQGEEQVCRRAYALIDGNTASVCVVSIIASQAAYSLHSRILQVRRIQIGSSEIPLSQKTRDELDDEHPGWWNVYGTPEGYIIEKIGEITFYPIPEASDIATMVVARLPLNSLTLAGSNSPEIKDYHDDLIIWGQHRAYMKNDSDTFNKELAEKYEADFTAKIGPLPTALEERRRKTWNRNMAARPREFGT